MGYTEKDWAAVAVDSRETPEEFLQRGGSVKKLAPGVTGEDERMFSWNSSRYPAGKNESTSMSAERNSATKEAVLKTV